MFDDKNKLLFKLIIDIHSFLSLYLIILVVSMLYKALLCMKMIGPV